jgi:hypothetical protein
MQNCREFLSFVVLVIRAIGGLGGAVQNSYRDVLVYSSFVHSKPKKGKGPLYKANPNELKNNQAK